MLRRGQSEAPKALDDSAAREIEQAFAAVLETDPGKLLFAHLFYLAGYDKADHVLSPRDGSLDESATAFNTIRRSFYVDVRRRVPKTHRKTLLEVELLAEGGWGSGLPKPAEKAENDAK